MILLVDELLIKKKLSTGKICYERFIILDQPPDNMMHHDADMSRQYVLPLIILLTPINV